MPIPLAAVAAGAGGALIATVIRFAIVKVLLSLGFGIIAFVGVDILITQIFDVIRQGIGTGDNIFIALVSLSRLDDCLEIIASAAAATFAIKQAMGFFKSSSFGNFTS